MYIQFEMDTTYVILLRHMLKCLHTDGHTSGHHHYMYKPGLIMQTGKKRARKLKFYNTRRNAYLCGKIKFIYL